MHHNSLQSIEYEIALLVRFTTAHYPDLGKMDRAEYLLLTELEENGPLGINALAEKLLLNVSTASRQIAGLEAKNHVFRYPDPKNGRISLVEITEQGRRDLLNVQQARSKAYAEIFQDWSHDELEQLEQNLARMNRDLKMWKKE